MKSWPAKRITSKIAATNAIKIRAALLASIDKEKVAKSFLESHPQVTDDQTADRQRARDWAKVHVLIDSKPMQKALNRVHAEGWVTGDKAARSSIKSAAIRKAPTIAEIIRDPKANIWAGWKPGNEAAAALLNPPSGLRQLLEQDRVTIRGIETTSLDRLGTVLADNLRIGQTAQKTGKEIEQYLADTLGDEFADPSRALTIALTETSRAVNQASMDRYRESQIDQVEWLGIDPCEICADNDGETVTIGDTFPSGDDAPPAHPNCVCTLLPVLPDMGDIELSTKPDLTKFLPGPQQVDDALSRLTTLPNPNDPSIKKQWKYVESCWKTVDVPTLDPKIWDKADLAIVKMDELVGTDPYLKRKKVESRIEGMGQAETPFRNFALVAEIDGQKVILDGHHRLMAMWLMGMDEAPVWLAKQENKEK